MTKQWTDMTGTFTPRLLVDKKFPGQKLRTNKITEKRRKDRRLVIKKQEFIPAGKLAFLGLLTSKNKHTRPSHKAPNVFLTLKKLKP